MAIAIVAVVLMILGMTNVVLNINSMTTGSKDQHEKNPSEHWHNDTENERESERYKENYEFVLYFFGTIQSPP